MRSERRGSIAQLIGRLGLGLVFFSFGAWELLAPSQWAGYVPPLVATHLPALPLVIGHGWLLLMVGAALFIDFLPGIVPWVAVGIMGEIVIGLLLGKTGASSILVRDLGLLGLSLQIALQGALQPQQAAAPAAQLRHASGR